MRTIYTADATVTGGRLNGRRRTPDGRLELALRMPAELGGPGDARPLAETSSLA